MEGPSTRFLLGFAGLGAALLVIGLLLPEPGRQALVILGVMILAVSVITKAWSNVRPSSLDRRH